MEKGNQPVLFVRAKTLPEAFAMTLRELWEKGTDISTSFDNPGDPPSKDASVLVEIEDPFAEPCFHKLGWPGGPQDMEVYRLEVVAGVHDHWVERGGVKWNYTYHERLVAYDPSLMKKGFWYSIWHLICLFARWLIGRPIKKIDQIENMIKEMVEAPDLYRRRFQVTTWIPGVDPFIKDPPCLQRLHFRWLPGENDTWVLNLNSSWRSRDFLKAWFMNVRGMIDIQRLVAQEVGKRRGIKVKLGRYTDFSDSLHIYGKDFYGVGGTQECLNRINKQSFEELTWTTDDFKEAFIEARHILAAQLESEKRGSGKGVILPDIDGKTFPYPAEWDL